MYFPRHSPNMPSIKYCDKAYQPGRKASKKDKSESSVFTDARHKCSTNYHNSFDYHRLSCHKSVIMQLSSIPTVLLLLCSLLCKVDGLTFNFTIKSCGEGDTSFPSYTGDRLGDLVFPRDGDFELYEPVAGRLLGQPYLEPFMLGMLSDM